MYLEPWNNAYWLSEFHVEPVEQERPQINEKTFLELQWELYPTGEQEEQILIKLEESHFDVESSQSTPIGVLGIPKSAVENLHVRNLPSKKPVLVVKPWFQNYVAQTETVI